MKRREFMKLLAITTAGVVAGGSVLTSCTTDSGKKRLVFFFTGTGNSLYVAKKIGGQLISIPQALRQGNLTFDADEIGLVYPIYGHMPPAIVHEFLEKAKLNAPYMFAVATFGARKCNAVDILEATANAYGHHFDYRTTINMVDNFLVGFDMDEEIKMDKHEEENLAAIVADINEAKVWVQPYTEEEKKVHDERYGTEYVRKMTMPASNVLKVDRDSCVGCGFCTRVCPMKNWKFTANGVMVDGTCQMCLSCIHNCPQKAIKLNMHEVNPNARYRHPKITLQEIVRANMQ